MIVVGYEIFKISKLDQQNWFLKYKAPKGFRFVKVEDFTKNGKRIDQLTIFIKIGRELQEYQFNDETNRNFIQFHLNWHRLFIKTTEIKGEIRVMTDIIIPNDEFLKRQLKK